MNLNWGTPSHPSSISVRTHEISWLEEGERKRAANVMAHRIARWYGISFRHRWFIGALIFDRTTNDSVPAALTEAKAGERK